ncbi:glycine--tRNA ligase subunit beta [Sandaracinus amylolyticus]|uniref:Glycine--tRNA ligase beta subunit n=1 Tax=Sandaracinus amylolyticus TaxID=927083 RepID=A0A0F6W3P0_9BACT|nr:glycine--tRNA ligase subunit beta [Sandaracinus amylolyticus]AKF06598.1 Glycyl-tRNA synthetase beta chain [Sandaracinus amylolyticus]
MTAHLLLEIGTEELPASFVAKALKELPGILTQLLDHARIGHGSASSYGTPRRLAVLVNDVADRQTDLEEEVLGPPKAAAFEADGRPKKAAEGFAKKNGIAVDQIRVVTTDKGEYAAVTRRETGRAASEVLPAILADAIAKIPFPKSMRWGQGDVAFGRPVHWLVALHGKHAIATQFAGIASGTRTRGHRFLAAREIEIPEAGAYLAILRDAHVLADERERRRVMIERLEAKAREIGGDLVPDEFLVEENASLVEEPHVIAGSFEEAYLSLPDEVIVAVMRGHQRYFAVKAKGADRLMPRYLAVVNTALDPATVTNGNDRALRPRLADARFFVETDRQTPLAARVPKLDGIVFQAKLGSVGEKTVRVGELAARLSNDGRAVKAAPLAKADLVTLIVGEFPELQGLMGRWYAQQQGVEPDVADAIRDHYLPKSASDAVPSAPLSAALSIADRADTLVGCFGIGIVPTGGADPFALRRAALAIARTALEGPIDVDLRDVLAAAWRAYDAQGKKLSAKDEVLAKLDEFFRTRLRGLLSEQQGHPVDLVDACLGAWEGRSIRDLAARVRALAELRKMPAYESLAVAFKRAYNIAKDAPSGDPDPALFDHEAERALAARFSEIRSRVESATQSGDYVAALTLVAKELREPIDRFFDQVFVMVDDTKVRDNRLRLLGAIARTMTRIAHFHLLGGA